MTNFTQDVENPNMLDEVYLAVHRSNNQQLQRESLYKIGEAATSHPDTATTDSESSVATKSASVETDTAAGNTQAPKKRSAWDKNWDYARTAVGWVNPVALPFTLIGKISGKWGARDVGSLMLSPIEAPLTGSRRTGKFFSDIYVSGPKDIQPTDPYLFYYGGENATDAEIKGWEDWNEAAQRGLRVGKSLNPDDLFTQKRLRLFTGDARNKIPNYDAIKNDPVQLRKAVEKAFPNRADALNFWKSRHIATVVDTPRFTDDIFKLDVGDVSAPEAAGYKLPKFDDHYHPIYTKGINDARAGNGNRKAEEAEFQRLSNELGIQDGVDNRNVNDILARMQTYWPNNQAKRDRYIELMGKSVINKWKIQESNARKYIYARPLYEAGDVFTLGAFGHMFGPLDDSAARNFLGNEFTAGYNAAAGTAGDLARLALIASTPGARGPGTQGSAYNPLTWAQKGIDKLPTPDPRIFGRLSPTIDAFKNITKARMHPKWIAAQIAGKHMADHGDTRAVRWVGGVAENMGRANFNPLDIAADTAVGGVPYIGPVLTYGTDFFTGHGGWSQGQDMWHTFRGTKSDAEHEMVRQDTDKIREAVYNYEAKKFEPLFKKREDPELENAVHAYATGVADDDTANYYHNLAVKTLEQEFAALKDDATPEAYHDKFKEAATTFTNMNLPALTQAFPEQWKAMTPQQRSDIITTRLSEAAKQASVQHTDDSVAWQAIKGIVRMQGPETTVWRNALQNRNGALRQELPGMLPLIYQSIMESDGENSGMGDKMGLLVDLFNYSRPEEVDVYLTQFGGLNAIADINAKIASTSKNGMDGVKELFKSKNAVAGLVHQIEGAGEKAAEGDVSDLAGLIRLAVSRSSTAEPIEEMQPIIDTATDALRDIPQDQYNAAVRSMDGDEYVNVLKQGLKLQKEMNATTDPTTKATYEAIGNKCKAAIQRNIVHKAITNPSIIHTLVGTWVGEKISPEFGKIIQNNQLGFWLTIGALLLGGGLILTNLLGIGSDNNSESDQ